MGLFLNLATASSSAIDWSTVVTASTFQPLVDGLVSLVPIIIAILVPLLCIRKGLDFIKGNVYSA